MNVYDIERFQRHENQDVRQLADEVARLTRIMSIRRELAVRTLRTDRWLGTNTPCPGGTFGACQFGDGHEGPCEP